MVYALLKDAFEERVLMLYTDTDSLYFYFFVENFAQEINLRSNLWDAFDFSDISIGHCSNFGRGNAELFAGEVVNFKDETKGNPNVEFVGLRPKMYLFTMCDASEPIPWVNFQMDVRHKAVAKGVARPRSSASNMRTMWRMYNGGALTNVVNRRIGSKLD